MVRDDDDLMLITDAGTLIRTPVRGISVIGRNTQGVRLIDLVEGEKVAGVATLGERDTEGESGEGEGPAPVPAADAGGDTGGEAS